MAINAYTGLMGSGKTYEVVCNVILPAVEQGRRIVTNIEGIKIDLIHQHLANDRKDGKTAKDFGGLVHVTNDDVHSPNFFYYGKPDEVQTIVKPGDLVLIDEAWRFWGTGNKVHPNHMIFFREHRHFVDERRFTCDLVVIVQDIADLNRQLKNVLELTFRTTKLKALGLNKSYRVDMYESYKVRAKPLSQQIKTYNKAFFPFYSSYSGGPGKEKAIDSRQNILKQKKLWLTAAGAVVFIGFAVWNTVRFFQPKPKPDASAQTSPDPAQAPSGAVQPVQRGPESESSSGAVLKGYWRIGAMAPVGLVQTSAGYVVHLDKPVSDLGVASFVTLDGKKVRFGDVQVEKGIMK